jgi:hypothetical protein
MLTHTAFSLGQASASQIIAYFGGAAITIAFFVWVASLVTGRPQRVSPNAPLHAEGHEGAHEMEEYAGGYIEARTGHIPAWLLVVYVVLFLWALYYGWQYWGGLGPGRPA